MYHSCMKACNYTEMATKAQGITTPKTLELFNEIQENIRNLNNIKFKLEEEKKMKKNIEEIKKINQQIDLLKPNIDTYNIVINAYALQKAGDKVIELYDEIQNIGLIPNELTCLRVLEIVDAQDPARAFALYKDMTKFRLHYRGRREVEQRIKKFKALEDNKEKENKETQQ